MTHNDKLVLSVLAIFFFLQCGCVVFQPPDQREQQYFLIFEDRFDAGGSGTGNGLESLLQFFPLFLIVTVIATIGRTSPSTTTAANKCNCQCGVTLPPTTQTPPPTSVPSTTNKKEDLVPLTRLIPLLFAPFLIQESGLQ